MNASDALLQLIDDLLLGGDLFLSGLNRTTNDPTRLVSAAVDWANRLQRDLSEVIASIEPCLRQSILMSLLPAAAFDPNYQGSIERAVDDHLAALGIELPADHIIRLRDICLNAKKLQGMNAQTARNRSMSIAQLRGLPKAYQAIRARQSNRCIWCGTDLDNKHVTESLEHVAPKHIGNDAPDTTNWALACIACNQGKSDVMAWAARKSAHDYMGRTDFAVIHSISLQRRWSVLMRTGACDRCKSGPDQVELFVYRRIRTGLPIPSNCSAICGDCAGKTSVELIAVMWPPVEQGRMPAAVD